MVQQKKVEEEKKPAVIAKQIIQSTSKEEETNEEKEEEQKEEKQTEEKQEEKKVVKTTTKTKSNKTETVKLEAVMDKVDEVVKDTAKNLEVKNLIKLDAMQSDALSLDLYTQLKFYLPKDIYIDQNFIIDNRDIYNKVTLASYEEKDPLVIKEQILWDINIKKQRLLLKLEKLKNG